MMIERSSHRSRENHKVDHHSVRAGLTQLGEEAGRPPSFQVRKPIKAKDSGHDVVQRPGKHGLCAGKLETAKQAPCQSPDREYIEAKR